MCPVCRNEVALCGASGTQESSENGNEMSILVQEIDLLCQKYLNIESRSAVGKSVAPGARRCGEGAAVNHERGAIGPPGGAGARGRLLRPWPS